MYISLIKTNQQPSQLRQRMTTSLLLLATCVASAAGQEASSGTSELFSPPSVGGAAQSVLGGSEPLPLTNALVPNSSIFGAAPAPHVDLSGAPVGSAVDQAVGGTPGLLSTPGIVDDSPAVDTSPAVDDSPALTSPVASNGTSTPEVDNWGSTTNGYQTAASLWGGNSGYPPTEPSSGTLDGMGCGEQSYRVEYGAATVVDGGGCGHGCGVGCGCGNRNCGSICGCGPCTWARFDVLLWNMSGYLTPALVTAAPGNVVQNGSSALGGDRTQVLYGNQRLGDDLRIGGRFQYGAWFDECREFGIQMDFFGLGGDSQSRTFGGDGNNIYARPFFNTDPDINRQDAQVFAIPGYAEGSVRFDNSSEIWSMGPALRFNLCCCCDPCTSRSRRVDFLLGYRFFRLEERFSSHEILRPTYPGYVEGTSFELNDSIRTRNDFHGVEFGVNRISQRGSWLWDVTALVALGEVERVVDLNGSTRINVPGFSDNTFPGGFFVGPRDIGRFRDNDFAAIPQVRANLSYCIGRNWRLSAGYNFMYLSSAFRPGQFLNTSFDGSRLGQDVAVDTVRRPNYSRDNLFLHGANVGLTYNF